MTRLVDDTPSALPLHLVPEAGHESWKADLPETMRGWVENCGFVGKLGQWLLMPDAEGRVAGAAFGWGTSEMRARRIFNLAAVARRLPEGPWRIVSRPEGLDPLIESLGWLLEGYRFDRYRDRHRPTAALVTPAGADRAFVERLSRAEFLARDLVNTPASDLGPAALEAAAADLAAAHGARFRAVRANDLLEENLPLIHAVGRAAGTPRLIDMSWGERGPRITIAGKGVCFDTGGLDLKPSSAMNLMKKDMGGAAAALATAQLVMESGLPVRLRVLIPAVENAVAGNAFRPGDILKARNGRTIEVNNTDAEGRLVLADALALGAEDKPDFMVSLATLTGAARIALGPDLPPLYCDEDDLAGQILAQGRRLADPLWRMPLWPPYEKMIEPESADLDNAPRGGMAGSITAALFLRRFAEGTRRYAHLDIYAWSPEPRPGLARGGLGQGSRALFGTIEELARG